MSTTTVAAPVTGKQSGGAAGVTALAAGITAAVLTALSAVVTFTLWLEATVFNGPAALLGFLGVPAALLGLAFGVAGLRSSSRNKAIAGMVLCAASLAAWVLIIVLAPWPE